MSWGGRKVQQLRQQVISLYGTTCCLCGRPIDLSLPRSAAGSFSIEHVIPRSKGGGDGIGNLRPAHRLCNMKKGNRPIRPIGPIRETRISAGWFD